MRASFFRQPTAALAGALAGLSFAVCFDASYSGGIAVISALGVCVAVLVSAALVGRFLLDVLGWRVADPLRPHVDLALGLAAFIAFVGFAGSLGLLSRALLVVAVAGPLVAGAVALARAQGRDEPDDRARGGWRAGGQRYAVLAILPVVLAYASLPPAFYDTVVYHLGLPNLYALSGAIVTPERFALAFYPQNAELLSTLALVVSGGVERAPQLLNASLAALAALLVASEGRRRFGLAAGALAGAVLCTGWFFWFEAVTTKNDLLGAYILLLAILVASRADARWRELAIGALLAGVAIGVKFANLLPVVLVALVLAWRGPTRAVALRRAGLWLLLALAVSAPWMARNTIERGNPLFPAFYEVLGGRGWSDENAERMRASTGTDLGRAPRSIIARWSRIGWSDADYGSGGEVGPWFLPLYLLGFAMARRREERVLIGLGLGTLLIGTGFFSTYLRVHALALLLFPLAAVAPLERASSRTWRMLGVALLATLALWQLGESWIRVERVTAGGSRVLLGRVSDADYLAGLLNYHPLVDRIDARLPEDARILVVGSARTLYLPRPWEASYAWDTPWVLRALDPDARPESLRRELIERGLTHLFLNADDMRRLEREQGIYGLSADPARRRRFEHFLAALTPVLAENDCYLFEL